MRMTVVNKNTGEVERYICCDKIGFINAAKAITVVGTADECRRYRFKPWEIVYNIEMSYNRVIISSEQYLLSFK